MDERLTDLIRQRFTPSLIAAELVSVQPMTGPTGLIFTMGHTTSEELAKRREKEERRKSIEQHVEPENRDEATEIGELF